MEQQRKINDIFAKRDAMPTTKTSDSVKKQHPDNSSCEGKEMEMQSQSQLPSQINEEQVDKGDKHDKTKSKLNRELGDLSDNEILPSRLRSSSGRVYSTGMMINTVALNNQEPSVAEANQFGGNKNPTLQHTLSAVLEEETVDTMKSRDLEEMDCCRNSATLVNMMANVQKSIDALTSEVRNQNTIQTNMQGKLNAVEAKQNSQEEDISQLIAELKSTKAQVHTLSKIVTHQDQQISILNGKLIDSQARSMNANVVISGITEHKKEDLYKQVQSFIENKLEIQELIPLNSARRLGFGAKRPILAQLRHTRDKIKIFEKVSKLKGQKNEKGDYYFISDHLPEALNEQRHRRNDLMTNNKKKDATLKQDMKIQGGKLFINEELYEKQIHTPTPRELLYPDRYTQGNSSTIKLFHGEDDNRDNSKFVGYAAAVKDLDDVQAAYFLVKKKHAEATHVACAFRIPGENTATLQDYVDDGEFGAGRSMLKWLEEESLFNILVFMVRYFGKKHSGPGRFEIFKQVTKSAFQKLSKSIAENERARQEEEARLIQQQATDPHHNSTQDEDSQNESLNTTVESDIE